MTNLETIRAACIKSNPEIVELKFGCEVVDTRFTDRKEKTYFLNTTRNRTGNIQAYVHCGKTTWYVPASINDHNLKIIGRPIHLADVLLAIGEIGEGGDISIAVQQQKAADLNFVIRRRINREGYFDSCWWDLKHDDLSQQSEKTINFIAGLLE